MSRRHWRLFGITLAADFQFRSRLVSDHREPDLIFDCGPPPAGGLRAADELYVSPQRIETGAPLCALWRSEAYDVLRFAGIGDFYVMSDRIVGHLVDGVDSRLVEIRFLGSVLAYWLECRGILAVHASAVDVEGRAIAFLSGNFSGKTGLAGSLIRKGHGLLTDDILPVAECGREFVAYPGYPQMRMWPDLATHFLGSFEELETVHPSLDKRHVKLEPGSFCDRERPLAQIYLPERRAVVGQNTCEVCPVTPRDALIELVRHSFSPFLVEAIGLQPQRLDKISRLLERVSMRRLRYPEGFENLDRAAAAILSDLTAQD